MDIKDIENLIDEGTSIYEIAERYSSEFCVEDFEMHNELCHEDADCSDCWIKCLGLRISK